MVRLNIEIPKDCGECPCCEGYESFLGDLYSAKCRATGKEVLVYIGEERPDFCPMESEE